MYIISHDIGTSSDKAILVDFNGKIIDMAVAPYNTYYPYPAWVEQKPEEYWAAVTTTTTRARQKGGHQAGRGKRRDIYHAGYGHHSRGRKRHRAVPQHHLGRRQAQKQADAIMNKFGGKKIFTLLAGTPIMGKDVIAKIIWLKEERPDVYNRTKCILDVNGYLKFKCTGRMVAELSGASSYGLDLKKRTGFRCLS